MSQWAAGRTGKYCTYNTTHKTVQYTGTGALPDTLPVSAGRALLSVYVSDPAATVGLALGQLVSLGVTTKKCPSDEN